MGGKGSGRISKYDPEDPSTWPVAFKRQEEKMLYLFDILAGHLHSDSPKTKYLNELYENKDYVMVPIDREMMETIADIQALYKAGGFGSIPQVVCAKWARRYPGKLPFDIEDIDNPNPVVRPWKPTSVIRLAIEIMRLYLMGTCPITRRVMKKVLTLQGKEITLHQLANIVEEASTFEEMIRVEEEESEAFDFNFSEEIDFD